MQMTAQPSEAAHSNFALVLVAFALVSMALVTSVVAASPSAGSSYPIEIMRAHAQYKVNDPVFVQVGFGVHGDR